MRITPIVLAFYAGSLLTSFAEEVTAIEQRIDGYSAARMRSSPGLPEGISNDWLPVILYKIDSPETTSGKAISLITLLAYLIRKDKHPLSQQESQSAIEAINRALNNAEMKNNSGVSLERAILIYCKEIPAFSELATGLKNSEDREMRELALAYLKSIQSKQ